jgi:hypothetical protein
MLGFIWPSPTKLGRPLALAAPNQNGGAAAPMVVASDSSVPGGKGGVREGVKEEDDSGVN